MITTTFSHETLKSTNDLETARALFAVGDYDDVLALVTPIIDDSGTNPADKCSALRLQACVETERKQYGESLETLAKAGHLIDEVSPDMRAKFFGQRGLAKRNLGNIDAALVDYAAARHWACEAGDKHTEAGVRNNLAKIYSDVGRFEEAIIEVDIAIQIALRLQDDISLGRYYDLKAQILSGKKFYAESLGCSKKALALLVGLPGSHPALIEARVTHGRILIALGGTYLEQPDPIGTYCAMRDAAKLLPTALDKATLRLALSRSGGHVLGAAKLLHIRHSALSRAIEKQGLDRQPKRRRRKSLITK